MSTQRIKELNSNIYIKCYFTTEYVPTASHLINISRLHSLLLPSRRPACPNIPCSHDLLDRCPNTNVYCTQDVPSKYTRSSPTFTQ